MHLRAAAKNDVHELYKIGKSTLELKVSAIEEFMDLEELQWSITNPKGIFLVTEDKRRIMGFIYATTKDIERSYEHKYARLVYLVVIQEFRGQGIAQKLYAESTRRLKTFGVTNIQGLANAESNGGIIQFLKKQGFTEGHKYIWMDKKIS